MNKAARLGFAVLNGNKKLPPEMDNEQIWAILNDDSISDAAKAVTIAVTVMEDDPAFNAGLGSVLTKDGGVEMDAGIAEGASIKYGAVAAARKYCTRIC